MVCLFTMLKPTNNRLLGGEDVTTTVEGQERYAVNVRYPSELRDSVDKLRHVLIATPSGAQIPLGEVANIVIRLEPFNDSQRKWFAGRVCVC